MDHHMHHHNPPPLHWGYSGTPPSSHAAVHNTWVPPPSRSLKRSISESDCDDNYSETSSKEWVLNKYIIFHWTWSFCLVFPIYYHGIQLTLRRKRVKFWISSRRTLRFWSHQADQFRCNLHIFIGNTNSVFLLFLRAGHRQRIVTVVSIWAARSVAVSLKRNGAIESIHRYPSSNVLCRPLTKNRVHLN